MGFMSAGYLIMGYAYIAVACVAIVFRQWWSVAALGSLCAAFCLLNSRLAKKYQDS